MTFMAKGKPFIRGWALVAGVAILTACAAPQDDLTNSRLTQPPAGTPVPPPTEAGDIAIAGQFAAHAIMDLPEVANAASPPLVQFTGVTSIIVGPTPVDTEPYTDLLRDRLLLITREKLRFVERTLPPLVTSPERKGKKKHAASTPEVPENPDYEVLAELHGRYNDNFYKVQIQFVDSRTGAVLFDGLYRIGKETPSPDDTMPAPPDANTPPPTGDNSAPFAPTGQTPAPATAPGMTQ